MRWIAQLVQQGAGALGLIGVVHPELGQCLVGWHPTGATDPFALDLAAFFTSICDA